MPELVLYGLLYMSIIAGLSTIVINDVIIIIIIIITTS